MEEYQVNDCSRNLNLCKSIAFDEMYLGVLIKLTNVTVTLSLILEGSFNKGSPKMAEEK